LLEIGTRLESDFSGFLCYIRHVLRRIAV
jgi:hypothetical protein